MLKTIKNKQIKSFYSQKILNKNGATVYKIKEVLVLNKPADVGMCRLDFSY